MTHADVALTRTIRARVPSVPYERIARSVLGARYELSLVLCGDSLARRMNREYRKKVYSPNVLSFPLSQHEGEIFLNVRKAEREAKQFGTSVRVRLALLFIHGCLHLKGYAHGSKMEKAEEKILRKFNIK